MLRAVVAPAAVLAGTIAVPAASGAAAEPALAVAVGTVTGGQGQPLAGVAVRLYAWPVSGVLAQLVPGQPAPWRLVGSGVTGADGRYSIGVGSAAALAADASADGTVNLEAVAVGAGGLGLFSFSRRLAAGGTGTAAPPVKADLRVRAATRTGGPALTGSQPALCTNPQFVKSFGPQWALVGQTYVTTSGVTQGFTYQYGQSSSLGVGVSPDAAPGTFSQGGTMSQSSTLSETFPTYGAHTNVYYFTEFVYGLFKIACVAGRTPNGAQPNYIVYYQTQVTGYAGGTKVRFPYTAPSAKNCVQELGGSTTHSNNSSAVTWSDGLVIPVIGASLSAQTGYDASAQLTYHYAAAGWLCGTGGLPGEHPYQLVAKT